MALPRSQNVISGLLLLSIASACSRAPDRITTGQGAADGLPPGVTVDPFVEPEKLKLGAVTADAASLKAYDFTKVSEIAWASSAGFVLAHGDGKSIAYDFTKAAWTSVHTSEHVNDYVSLYDFRDAGFFGTTADVLSFRIGAGKIIQLKIPENYKTATVLGSNPGFVGYNKDELTAITTSETAAQLNPLTGAPDALKLIYPCNKHCLLWGFDGSKVFLFFPATGWKRMEQAIELPAGEKIARMAIRFRDTNNPVAAESILVQSEDGKLFAQIAGTVTKTDVSWADIKPISDRFCAQCHLDDGFEKESTWKTLKSAIVTRLKLAPGSKGAMPPTETNIGKEMSQGERNLILAWIEKQEQTDRGGIGSTTDPTVDTSEVTGELKTYSDKYCLACHADYKKNAYWKLRKSDSISRIQSDNMPKNGALTADEKKKFIELINAIK